MKKTRVKEISKKCINVKHRHIVFTISNRLWPYFQKDRSLIDCLFEAVNQTFNYMVLKAGKLKEYKFGFISTLHTFGRDLKFNPHLHVLVAECIIDKQNNVKNYNHFHNDNKIGRQFVTEHIFDFIKKLIIHIPDTGKHNIRYYGFYANKAKQRPIIRNIKWPLYHSKVIKQMIAELSWKNKILKSFNYDILMCDRCGKTLILVPDMCFISKRLKRKRCYG